MFGIWYSSTLTCKVLQRLHPIRAIDLFLLIFVFNLVQAFTHQHAHGIGVSQPVNLLLFFRSVLLELLENFQSWRNIDLTFSIFFDEFGQSNSEFLSDQAFDLISENPIWLLVSEEVEIGFILFKFFSDEI